VGPNQKMLLHTGNTTEVEKGRSTRGRAEKDHYTKAIQSRWKRVVARAAEPKKVTTSRRSNRREKGCTTEPEKCHYVQRYS
jgi:hypothetical protein